MSIVKPLFESYCLQHSEVNIFSFLVESSQSQILDQCTTILATDPLVLSRFGFWHIWFSMDYNLLLEVTKPYTDPNYGCLTSVIKRELVKQCHWPWLSSKLCVLF